MQSDGEPQVAGAPQCQREKHRDHEHAEGSNLIFSAVPKVKRSKRRGQCRGRRPKSDPGSQRELGVTAKQKFLEETHAKKHHAPKYRVAPQRSPAQGELAERESPER